MAVDFSNTLIVAISATALFDLTEFEQKKQQFNTQNCATAKREFAEYVKNNENTPLQQGTGYPLIKALLHLNSYQEHKAYHDESPLVEVVIVSKSTPDMGISVLNSIRHYKLPITRSAFISGTDVADYIHNFKVDLFLTTNKEDAQAVIDKKVCACAIVDAAPINSEHLDTDQLRIAFDGDAVLFDEAAELMYQEKGLAAFHEYEKKMENNLIKKGPYADFIIKLSALQQRLPLLTQTDTTNSDTAPIVIALVTARNAPADLRAIKTLRAWGVTVDVAFFLGGLPKTPVLQTFAPHIFFDDSLKHIDLARAIVPSAHVPYRTESKLNHLSAALHLSDNINNAVNQNNKSTKFTQKESK